MAKTKKYLAAVLAVSVLLSLVAPFTNIKAEEETEKADTELVDLAPESSESIETLELKSENNTVVAEEADDELLVSAVRKHCSGMYMLMLKYQASDIASEKGSRTSALIKRDAEKKKKAIKAAAVSTASSSAYGDNNASGVLKKKYNEKFTKDVTDKEYEILCRIVQAEAGDQDVYGRILVANVILNRVNYEKEFPNDIEGVVFEKKQFSPISNGAYYRVVVDELTTEAVDRALAGEDYSDGALYFFMRSATAKSTASWFDSLTFVVKYGCHEFFKD